MVLYTLFVFAVAVTTVGWARHADQRIRDVQRQTCVLLAQVTNNQVYVLRHHYAAVSRAERDEIARRIRGIQVSIRGCD